MRWLLLLALALYGCESTALALDDPSAVTAVMDHPYMDGATFERDVLLTIAEAPDPEDMTGDLRTFSVLSWDLGEGLELTGWEFLSNYRLRLSIRRFADAPEGLHNVELVISNHFGVFAVSGEFFIFL